MAWVENLLNLSYSYYWVTTSSEGDQFEYLVPTPLWYDNTMKAYWTTDVIVFEPSCSWQTPTIMDETQYSLDVSLYESNSSFVFMQRDESMFLLTSNFSCVFTRFQYISMEVRRKFQFIFAAT